MSLPCLVFSRKVCVSGPWSDSRISSAFKTVMFAPIITERVAPFFHLLGLPRGFVEARLKVRPSVFPSHLDGGFHVVCQDDELRRPAVIMDAKADDIHLSHSGRESSEKTGAERGGRLSMRGRVHARPLLFSLTEFPKATDNTQLKKQHGGGTNDR